MYGNHRPPVPPSRDSSSSICATSTTATDSTSTSMTEGDGHLVDCTPSKTKMSSGGNNFVRNRSNGSVKKSAPVCTIPSLKIQNMTSEAMSQWCFREEDVWEETSQMDYNDDENEQDGNRNGVGTNMNILQKENHNDSFPSSEQVPISPKQWMQYKDRITKNNQMQSRSGRETQRFATDEQTGQLLRLTTGCVPIMKDGKILLVSSSKKEEWILPKGGWESDETIEVSAIREAHEEGGILGVLGQNLAPIEFETRKAKKRRLELGKETEKGTSSSAVSVQSNTSSIQSGNEDFPVPKSVGPTTKITNELPSSNGINNERNDDSSSMASSVISSNCTHVRLVMFPLYVLSVQATWPESGRARKIVDIDTAIEIMSSRPEFHSILEEVKAKGLHLEPKKHILNRTKPTNGNVDANYKESII